MPGQPEPGQPELIDHASEIARERRDAVFACGIALSVPALVVRDGAKTCAREGGEIADENIGLGAKRGTVQKDHGRALAFLDVAQLQPVDADELVLHASHEIAAHAPLLCFAAPALHHLLTLAGDIDPVAAGITLPGR